MQEIVAPIFSGGASHLKKLTLKTIQTDTSIIHLFAKKYYVLIKRASLFMRER